MFPFDEGLPRGIATVGRQPMPTPPPVPRSFGQTLVELLPYILGGMNIGSGLRQGDTGGVSSTLGQLLNIPIQRRRQEMAEQSQRRADEAQQLRADRELRLAENADARMAATDARDRATSERSQKTQLANYLNTTEDNLRQQAAGGRSLEGAGLEDYMTAHAGQFKELGGDPARLRALIMSVATQMSKPEPEVPYVERQPGTAPPATVKKGTVIRNAPRAAQPKEGPLPKSFNAPPDEKGDIYRVLTDPRTGKELSRTKIGNKPRTAKDEIDAIIEQALGGGGAAPAPAGERGVSPQPAPAKTGPAVGEKRRINGQLAQWDGKGWLPVK